RRCAGLARRYAPLPVGRHARPRRRPRSRNGFDLRIVAAQPFRDQRCDARAERHLEAYRRPARGLMDDVDSLGVRKMTLGPVDMRHEKPRADEAREPERETGHGDDRREPVALDIPYGDQQIVRQHRRDSEERRVSDMIPPAVIRTATRAPASVTPTPALLGL